MVVVALVAGLLAQPAAAQEHDPTEPDRPASSFAAYPGPSVSLQGITHGVSAIDRVAGRTRYDTAVQAAQRGWPAGAADVVVAPGEGWHDALSASSLAGAVRGPLLLATPTGLDEGTLAELRRLAPSTIHLVGVLPAGTAAQAEAVGAEVREVRGGDLHATSAAAAAAAVGAGADGSTMVVASALSAADALASSALAAGLGHPLLLVGVEGMAEWLGGQQAQLGATRTLVVGGEAILPAEVLSQVEGEVVRLAGADRWATALAVADHARAAGLDGPPVVASGQGYADGLTGGVLAGLSHRAPLLLTPQVGITDSLATWLAADGASWVRIMGGTAAVGPVAECQLGQGDSRAWLCVEQELQAQGYNAGAVDGRIDGTTVWMTYAFQKVAELPVTGDFGEAEFQAMLTHPTIAPHRPDLEGDRIEVNIGRQLVLVIRDGEVIHQLHTSTGKSSTPTVRGVYRVYEMRNYRQTRNNMYRPVFFHRGYAFHGYPSVPLYPASAGCARMYDGDMDFLWPYLHIGEQIVTHL